MVHLTFLSLYSNILPKVSLIWKLWFTYRIITFLFSPLSSFLVSLFSFPIPLSLLRQYVSHMFIWQVSLLSFVRLTIYHNQEPLVQFSHPFFLLLSDHKVIGFLLSPVNSLSHFKLKFLISYVIISGWFCCTAQLTWPTADSSLSSSHATSLKS